MPDDDGDEMIMVANRHGVLAGGRQGEKSGLAIAAFLQRGANQ